MPEKCLNAELINKGFNQLTELSKIYSKMADAVERHRLEIISLIDLVQIFGTVDDTILERLDGSVHLLLKTLDALAKTPKDDESGLGGLLVPHILLFAVSGTKAFTNTQIKPENTILTGFRIPFPSGICLLIAFKPPIITFQYCHSNIEPNESLISFPLLNSNNVIDPISSGEFSNGLIFPDIFKSKLLDELVKLAAIINILNFETERSKDNACYYKKYAFELKAIE